MTFPEFATKVVAIAKPMEDQTQLLVDLLKYIIPATSEHIIEGALIWLRQDRGEKIPDYVPYTGEDKG